MPDNECDKSFAQNNDGLTTTRPLHIITQYPNSNAIDMQSPGRPTSLGICLSNNQNISDFKSCSFSLRSAISQENGNQSWAVRSVDTYEFEKLLGQLGNNGSTPVTPTSFLNPKNITEDQEMFADNFSRTLNKVKAEQEGWTTLLPNSTPMDNMVNNGYSKLNRGTISVSSIGDNTIHSDVNSTLVVCSPTKTITTTDQRHHTESSSFLANYPTALNSLSQMGVSDNRQLSPTQVSGSTVACLPNLADQPLVVSSKLSKPLIRNKLGLNSHRNNDITASQDNCSTSDSFQLAYYPSISNSPSRTANETTWVTGLPTILSIASGLKQAAAAAAAVVISPTTSPSTTNITTSNPINCNETPNFAQTTNNLSPNANGFVEQSYINDTLISTNEDELSQQAITNELQNVGLVANQISQVMTYTLQDDVDGGLRNRGSNQLTHHQHHHQQRHIDLIHSMPNSTTASNINLPTNVSHSRLENSNFGIREALSELYSAVCPTSTAAPRSLVEEDCKTSLALNLSSVSRSQSFDHLYSNMTDSYNNSLDEANEKALLLQTSTDFPSSSHHDHSRQHLLSTAQPVCDILLESPNFTNMCPSSTNPHNEGVLSNQILNLTAVPTFLCTTTTTTGVYEMNRDLSSLLSTTGTLSSSSSSLPKTVVPISLTPILQTSAETTVCSVNQFSSHPLSVANTLAKKSKRHLSSTPAAVSTTVPTNSLITTTKKCRTMSSENSNATNEIPTSTALTHCTKLCDNQNNSDVMADDHKSEHLLVNSCGLPSMHSDQISVLDNQSLMNCHQPGNYDHAFVLKTEPTQSDDLVDDVSTHSGGSLSVSTGPIHHHHSGNNATVSSLDEVEQHHLKLERKRARNRVAARRCRERKISLIRTLENQVAERDAHVKSLEETLARYRAEGERLRLHMEMLASSYPSLKAELYRIPFLFQQPSNHQSTNHSTSSTGVHSIIVDVSTDQSTAYRGCQTSQLTPLKTELSDNANSSKHFS